MRLCWIIADLGNYHAARMRALQSSLQHDLKVIELKCRSEYPEFAAARDAVRALHCRTLFAPDAGAISFGRLRGMLYRALDDARPDALFVNGWSQSSAILAMAWSMSHQVPFVIASESTAADQTRVAWREGVKCLLVRRAGAAFVGGRRSAQYLRTLGLPEASIFQGYDAVDNEHFAAGAEAARRAAAQVRSALNLPGRYLLCVARLIPRKGFAMLLEAFARYRAGTTTAGLDLLFVGDGSDRPRLMQLAAALGIDAGVHFHGFQGYDRLPSYYGLAEALIVPSRSEPWGLVVNEAMASALPVLVSSACGCTDDLVRHGHNGFVIDPTNVKELTELVRFIDAQPQRVRQLGRNAHADIGAWGLDHFAAQCWGAAKAAVATGPSRPFALEVFSLESFARTRPGLL